MSQVQLHRLLQEAVEHHRANRLDAAAGLYRRLLGLSPRLFDALQLYGTLLYQQGKFGDAVEYLNRALKVDPRSSIAEMRLGLALAALGEHASAVHHHQQALKLQPRFPEAWDNLAFSLKALGRVDEAVVAHKKAIEQNPRFAAAWNNLGLAYSYVGKSVEAIHAHEQALKLDSASAEIWFGYAIALQQLHRVPEAIAAYDKALKINPGHREAISARLMALHYRGGLSREAVFSEHLAFGKLCGTEKPRRFPNQMDPSKRLRIAFLSPDLRTHSVAFFLEPILMHFQSDEFEIYLYHDHGQVDETSLRLKTYASRWRNFSGQNNDAVEAVILADAPDVIVDLAGHTGLNRLLVLARRVAPVQIAYLGYPDTTGVEAIDFRFTDAITDPSEEDQRYHTERLVRFAPTAWTYRPPADSPECSRTVDGAEIVFGSFNNFAKVSEPTLLLWRDVLNAVPDSRLMLKGQGFHVPGVQERVSESFRRIGVDRSRVTLLGRTGTVGSHLEIYRQVDVALDAYPYNGTTTTCEALWMGVPVVTLAGNRHLSRVSASLLTAVGHSEWIAHSADDYARIARELAVDPLRLRARRSALRENVRQSVLLDHAGQSRRFAGAVREVWIACCQKQTQAA